MELLLDVKLTQLVSPLSDNHQKIQKKNGRMYHKKIFSSLFFLKDYIYSLERQREHKQGGAEGAGEVGSPRAGC